MTEMPKIEPVKKTGLVPSVAPEEPRVTKPKHEFSALLKADPSKKQEPALVPTKRQETSPVLLEVQKADMFKIAEITSASRELVEIHLAKKTEPTHVSSDIRKPEPSQMPDLPLISETVIKQGPKDVLSEAPEPELTQSPPELPRAKPEYIQKKKQATLSTQESPPKRGIITTI